MKTFTRRDFAKAWLASVTANLLYAGFVSFMIGNAHVHFGAAMEWSFWVAAALFIAWRSV